ncbi:isocitrate lyase [Xylariaceae sp. FL1272]|nr:isocitrate lyase [Xylariaceae sp. FL1272]
MPQINISVDEEQRLFEEDVAAIEKQWASPRQAHLKRPYSARTIAAMRNSTNITPPASSQQAAKLWNQLQKHRKDGTAELTFGTTDPVTVSQMAKHAQTVYVSGALCGFSEVAIPGMDHADYPWDTVPKVVSKIFKSQLWHDQRQRQFRLRHEKSLRSELDNTDYLAPIVADGDMGFGSLTSTAKMAKEFVDAGVAMIHLDDLATGMKKFTVGQGRTVVPTSEYLDRLTAARMQFDIMGSETLLLCRCDTDHAEFITSVIDERDHEYVIGATVKVEPLKLCLSKAQAAGEDLTAARAAWMAKAGLKTFDQAVKAVASEGEYSAYSSDIAKDKFVSLTSRREIAAKSVKAEVFFDWDIPRSATGQYLFGSCVKAITERAVAAAPLGDVTWARMDTPNWKDIVDFHTEVRKVYPERLFAFGYTGDYDYAKAGFSPEQVKSLHLDLAKMGVVWQVQPIWSLQGLNYVTDKFAKMWSEEGIAGYMRDVAGPALAPTPITDGFEKLSYCGGYYADAQFEAIAGQEIVETSNINLEGRRKR